MVDDSTIIDPVAKRQPGSWRVEHSQQAANGAHCFVLRETASQRCYVLRNDISVPCTDQLLIDGIGHMTLQPALEDPAFAQLHGALSCYSAIRVLRYRPGKRITIAADDRRLGPVILKCTTAGVAATFARQTQVWAAREAFGFSVSRPLALASSGSYFVQSRLPGAPLRFTERRRAMATAHRLAAAIATLHVAEFEFTETFGFPEQRERTNRYLALIASLYPEYKSQCREIDAELKSVAGGIVWRRSAQLTPIHGSLHSHQWLCHASGLALVDFDRASMGHPELDIATFLAEWDFETTTLARAVQEAFMDAYASCAAIPLNESAIAYYRAHKHLSKAYKASKGARPDRRAAKIARHLTSARVLLGGAH